MTYQTYLNSFAYKIGTLVPWCKKCGHPRLHKDGKSPIGKQRYECKECRFRGVWSGDLPGRSHFSDLISFAIEMYVETGISFRKLAKKIKKFFKIIVCHQTIRDWVNVFKKSISRRQNPIATVWHADETYIKIKGEGHYLWIVYCKDMRQVLAWHIGSRIRMIKDARKVIRTTLDNAGQRPLKIITDGLFQYAAAIKKIMGWKWNIYRERHIVDSGIGKNAIIEEVNREIKTRIR